MKNIYTIVFALLALLFNACAQGNIELPTTEATATISVDVTPEQTRTYTDGTKIFWHETGEQLNIIYFADQSTSRRQSATHQDYTLTDNRAQFTADFNKTEGASSYTFGAFYPYAYKSITSSITLSTLTEQTPTESSYDPAGDILISANPVVTDALPNKISFTFARMVAFAKMTIKGIDAGEKIQQIIFSSPAKPAGSVTVKVHEPQTVENAVYYNNYEDITLNMNGRVATGNDTVWFTAVPTELSGSSFTVTVVTDNYNYTKQVDLTGKTLTFERANIAQFTVKDVVKQEKPATFKLLTDLSQLTAGDKVIITNKKGANTNSVRALTTTAYDSSKIKLSTDYLSIDANVEIAEQSLPAGIAVFTVEAGDRENTFAFKDQSVGYLCGSYPSSSVLSFSATKEIGASWTVSLADNGATMSATYDGTNSRYLNNYDNYKMNYAASRGTSYHYYIFYIDGKAEEPETPETPVVTPLATPAVTATAAGNTVTATWAAVEGAADYTVTCGTATQTVTATTATFAELEYNTTYTVTVVANPADSAAHSASEAGQATATTEAAPAASSKSVTITFPADFPAGVASGNTVGTIYDGDVTISSTGSWRVNKNDGRDCIYMTRSSSSHEFRIEAKNGVTITKVTLTAPVGYLIDLKAKNYSDYQTTACSGIWEGECNSRLVCTPGSTSHTNIETIVVEYK